MRLIDIVNGPWAITPDMLTEIQSIYGRHLRGEKIDLNILEASLGRPLNSEPKGYEIVDGVAVLPVDGVIGKKMNLFTRISGGVSTDLTAREFNRAMADPQVKGIVLAIDSPGGTIDGTPDLAETIFRARGKGKPITAFTDGTMASAAYWIGSAADNIYISNETNLVGSIGVVTSHTDYSKAEEKAGIKTTEIYAGRYKRIASEHEPLTKEGRDYIQAMVDSAYSVFVDAVARHRGISTEEAQAMAEGRIFRGSQAIDVGLVDGVATLGEVIAMLNQSSRTSNAHRPAGAAVTPVKETATMTIEQLKADHPDLVEAIVAEATAGHAEALSAARAEGAAAELERVRSVRAQSIPGHETLIEALAMDGVSTAADAALAIVEAEKKHRGEAAAAIEADANRAVPASASEETEAKTMKRNAFNALPPFERAAVVKAGTRIVD